jgi:phosphoribosylformylglycinamidine (FGAM) synthase PurS component
MKAKVYVTLKRSVLDPQGKAVEHALSSMGFGDVKDVRVGKYIEIEFDTAPATDRGGSATSSGGDRAQAEKKIRAMCEKLLANTVIEDFKYELN